MPTSLPAEILSIEGPDALAFAHAQFGSHVDHLEIGRWQFSAWLDPQGRVRVFFHLARLADDRLLLLLRGGRAVVIAEALRRFVFRSKVRLDALPPRTLTTGTALPMHAFDTEMLSFGCGVHSLVIDDVALNDTWRIEQIRAGWAWLPDNSSDVLLPATLSLQRLGAVVVDKGCYPGQEIVARLHYRGGHKRHLHRVELSQYAVAGEILRQTDRDIGLLLDAVEDDRRIEALVILLDEVAAAAAHEEPVVELDSGLTMRLLETWPA